METRASQKDKVVMGKKEENGKTRKGYITFSFQNPWFKFSIH